MLRVGYCVEVIAEEAPDALTQALALSIGRERLAAIRFVTEITRPLLNGARVLYTRSVRDKAIKNVGGRWFAFVR